MAAVAGSAVVVINDNGYNKNIIQQNFALLTNNTNTTEINCNLSLLYVIGREN